MTYETYLHDTEEKLHARARSTVLDDVAMLDTIVIYGAGGFAFAYALAMAGMTTVLVEPDTHDQQRLADYLRASPHSDRLDQRLSITDRMSAFKAASICIDARQTNIHPVPTDDLRSAMPPDALLGVLTSCPVMGAHPDHAYDFALHLAQHLYGSADHTKLLEISAQKDSRAAALATKIAFQLGALPLVTSPSVGAIGAHLLAYYYAAADTIFLDGATPWDIDEAMTDYGFALGPYESEDLFGLDLGVQRRLWHRQTYPRFRHVMLIDRMLELGKLGHKTGAGWYRYPGGGGKVDDPIVADLAIEESFFAGTARSDYSHDTIRQRLLLSVINAIFQQAETSSVAAEMIDIVSVLGLGFPRHHGGLISYADAMGADAIIDQINRFAAEDAAASRPAEWHISPLISMASDRKMSLLSVLSG